MNLCICQLIKDEQPYIEEWIEYHHNLGFNHFYLIEDWCSSSHKKEVEKYDYVELYRLFDIVNDEEKELLNNSELRQTIVYRIFNRLWRKENDWLAFIDVDEYIDLTKEELFNILSMSKDVPTITMIWKMMECDDHIYHPNNWQKYSLLETYTNYNYNISFQKQLINCNEKFDKLFYDYEHTEIPHFIDPKYCNYKYDVYLKHFSFKSLEEYIYKLTNIGLETNAWFNRTFDEWFIVNSKYLLQKEELIRQFNIDKLIIKTNEYESK